jgi:hypothetical protein
MGRMIAHVSARESFMANLSFWLNLIVPFVLHENAISRTTARKKLHISQKNEDRIIGKELHRCVSTNSSKDRNSWYTYTIPNSKLTLNNSKYCIGYENTQEILEYLWI